MATDDLERRIIAALRDENRPQIVSKPRPMSRRELQETLNYEPGLDEALLALSDAGEARRFTSWPFYGGERVEYWTLTATGN